MTDFALAPEEFVRSLEASRATLGRPRMKLLEVVSHVRNLTEGAPYAVIGGLAQILWARKTHTDDLDVALTTGDLARAYERIRALRAGREWTLPAPPDRTHEADNVFEVYHLLCDGAVVDLIAFRDAEFNGAIIETAVSVHELDEIRFVRPELLLMMHLLRPGPAAALAAIELLIARRDKGGVDLDEAKRWAARLGRLERLERVLTQADALNVI